MIDSACSSSIPSECASLRVSLAGGYTFTSVDELRADVRRNLHGMIEGMQAQAFLFPDPMTSLALVPLTASMKAPMQAIASGVSWSEAVAILGLPGLQRLCTLGILGVGDGASRLTGPAAALLIEGIDPASTASQCTTDTLSLSALNHVGKLRLNDPLALMTRLYGYNSELIVPSRGLRDAVAAVSKLTAAPSPGRFQGFVSPPENPGWFMFRRRIGQSRVDSASSHAKLYVSPVVSDVSACLERLVSLIPTTRAYAWKVGQFSFGLSRPDKICVYFNNHESALEAAVVLRSELRGVRAQGVPFTQRIDTEGLISLAMDPPSLKPGIEVFSGNSWRMWVTRKLAAALLLAKRQPLYPLSPVQTALRTIHYLGVNPSTWETNNVDFWRN